MHVHILCFITEIDLKKASKTFAQHFSCGSAVTGDDEIVIQGDVGYDVIDFIQEKWPDVSRNVLYNYYVVCAWSRNGGLVMHRLLSHSCQWLHRGFDQFLSALIYNSSLEDNMEPKIVPLGSS